MKKVILRNIIVFLFIFIFIIFPINNVKANDSLNISAKSYVLIEKDTKKIISSSNESEKLPMASTTKIMTTILALESGNLDEPFTVMEDWVKVEGTSMGLLPNDTVTMRDLCYGMMLPSGNDAANVVAYKLAGSIEDFSAMMNEKAKLIGMNNTNFVTPSGLHDDNHYSTAYDMALLASYALKNDEFKKICSTEKIQLEYGNPPYKRWLSNHNKLLNMYDGCFGIKTGFTKSAGRCLVSAAEKDGKTLIAVTLNAPNDWQDHTRLYDYGFNNVSLNEYHLDIGEVYFDVVGGKQDKVLAKPVTSVYNTILDSNEMNNIKCEVISNSFLYAPISENEKLGTVKLTYNGELLTEIDLIATENIEFKKKVDIIIEDKNWLQRLIEKVKSVLVF